MTQTIEELLSELRQQHEALRKAAEEERQQAARFEQDAELIEAKIRGVEAAQDILTPPPPDGDPIRRHRRDIKALVREYLARYWDWTAIPEGSNADRARFIAGQIGCSRSQVIKALAAIDAEGGS